jgi:hypothetical protein
LVTCPSQAVNHRIMSRRKKVLFFENIKKFFII